MDIKKALMGKTISGYDLDDKGTRLILHVDGGKPITLGTDGECCSQTWIEQIDAPDALVGTVQDVEEIEMPNLGNIDGKRHQGVEEVAYYGLKITTNKGRCVIDYRNDSNGYYGGNLYVQA